MPSLHVGKDGTGKAYKYDCLAGDTENIKLTTLCETPESTAAQERVFMTLLTP